MEGYELPGYTLAEAMEKLGLNQTDLKHEVHTGNLTPVVYIAGRSMLLLSSREEGWIGHGSCSYRGHMLVHSDTILKLLDGETVTFATSRGRLLDNSGVSNWQTAYPFKSPTPHGPLSQWCNGDLERLPLSNMAATFYPKENDAVHKVVGGWMESLSQGFGVDFDQADLDKLNPNQAANDHTLDFKKNSDIAPRDLRIPKSEIERFTGKLKAQQESAKALEAIKSVTQKKPQQRENQLHNLIELILTEEPKISAKRAWAMIESDSTSDEPVFDKDGILLNVDADCIEWQSRHGAEQTLSWGSFQPLLTKLKRAHTENQYS